MDADRFGGLAPRALRTLLGFILIALALAAGGFSTPSHAQGGAIPLLFSYQPTGTPADATGGVPATLNVVGLSSVLPGGLVDFTTPDGRSFRFVFDGLAVTRAGSAHWIGHLDASGGENYRAVLTWGAGGFGHIATPDGEFVLESSGGVSRLVDVRRSPRRYAPLRDDAPIPPPPPPPPESPQGSAAEGPIAAADAPPGYTQIDVMVLYTNSLAALLGPDLVRTRIEFLIALANQAYVDSEVSIYLNLVHSAPVAYANTEVHTALGDLTNNRQNSGLPVNSGFGGLDVATLRTQYGADLVVLLKEYDSLVDTSAVGVGWLNGAGSAGTAGMQAGFGYAVVDNGNDINPAGPGFFVGNYAFAHELGHNMGSAHDRANAGSCSGNPCTGAFYYSFGYGDGTFGTIMSYLAPAVGKFSNPNVLCAGAGHPCGVSEAGPNTTTSANNALSLNNARLTVAGFKAPTGLSTTPGAFGFTSLVGANAGDDLESEAITVGGLTLAGGIAAGATAPISITGGGGLYSIDGGAFTAIPGTVMNGQTVRVRVTALPMAYLSAVTYLTIGTVTRAFSVTTRPASFAVTPGIAAGFSHSLALRADGTLFAWGQNDKGQLGDGTVYGPASEVAAPEALAISGVKAIAASSSTSLALKTDGTVWVWGSNSICQFGTGDFNCLNGNVPLSSSTPQQVSLLTGIISKISMSPNGGLALKSDGSVWSWGFTGQSAALAKVQSVGLDFPAVFTAIAAGSSFSYALAADQTVWAWGVNGSWQLGNEGVDFQNPYPQIAGLSGITAIAAGVSHGLALKSNGTVWAWGDNTYGQLGDGGAASPKRAAPAAVAGLPTIAAIVAGNRCNFAVGANGTLWAWGDNTYGQLGDGTSGTNRLAPVQVPISNVVAVASYFTHTLALLTDGSVWAWGSNASGQLGNNGTTGSSFSPTRAGTGFWYVGSADTEPSAFSFAARASAVPSTPADSAGVTVAGISLGAPISVTGGQYSINGGAYTGALGTINSGDQVRVRVAPPAAPGGAKTGTVTIGGVSAGFTATSRSRADFDGVGKSDVFWLHQTLTQTYIWQMNGAAIAGSGSPASTGDTGWQVKAIGDFDGDGKSDVLFRHASSGALFMWLMNGTTVSSAGSPGTVADLGWKIEGTGDFNGDGKSDVLWMHTNGTVMIWTMNGTSMTSADAVVNLGAASGWMVQGVGDFNGDGKADILWKHSGGTVVMWMMNGAAIANSGTVASVGPDTPTGWRVLGVGDFNGDGRADVLWRNDDIGGVIYVWLMNGTTITSATNVTGVGTEAATGWIVKSIGDYNGDGRADIFWKNDLTLGGITYVWLMGVSGTTIDTATSVTGVPDTGWQVVNPK